MFVDVKARASGEKSENIDEKKSFVDLEKEIKRRQRRNKRYILLGLLKKRMLKGKLEKRTSILTCSHGAVPVTRKRKDGSTYATGSTGEVLVKEITGTSKLGYSGLCRCGSGHICPVCNAILKYHRLAEIQQIIEVMFKNGYTVAHITLTGRHDRYTELQEFQKKFASAESDLKNSRTFRAFKSKIGGKYYIRVVEVTDDHPDAKIKTGWHYHIHTVLFIQKGMFNQKDADWLREKLKVQWVESLKKFGLSGEKEYAAKVQYISLPDEDDERAQINRIAEYVSKALQFELSGQPDKKTKVQVKAGGPIGRGRVTAWELQEMVLTRDQPWLYIRYNQYIRAMKGVNWIRCSKGLKDFCGVEQKTDQQIVNESKAEGEEVYNFTNEDFKIYAKMGFQGYILSFGEYAMQYGKTATKGIEDFVKQRYCWKEVDYNLVERATGQILA